jgi:hypothetical protein
MLCIDFSEYSGQHYDAKALTSEQIKILNEIFNAGGAKVYDPITGKVYGEFKVVSKEEE